MQRRAVLVKLVAAAALIPLAGCNSTPRKIHYRLTLDVEAPEGLRSGSSVVQVVMNYNDGLLKGMGNLVNPTFQGEATVVDLGNRGLLFCLLTADSQRSLSARDPSYLVSSMLPNQDRTERLTSFYDSLIQHKPKADVPLGKLPLLVRFRDVNDPKTAERVYPSNLAANFGQGVKLVRATIEITDAPVTMGIEKRLSWIADLNGSIGKNMALPYRNLLNEVSDGSFRQGFYQ
jgi:hypothetical protein